MHVFSVLFLNLFISIAVACKFVCSINFRPVCGYNGECYVDSRNVCIMRKINCGKLKDKQPSKKFVIDFNENSTTNREQFQLSDTFDLECVILH